MGVNGLPDTLSPEKERQRAIAVDVRIKIPPGGVMRIPPELSYSIRATSW